MTTRTATAPTKRKRKVALVAAALIGATSVGAYAFWSSTGAGTGSAATGDVAAITVVQTSTVSGLAPGLSAQDLSGNFNNPNSGPVYITSVTASISSVTKAVGAPAGTCDASDYTIAGTAPVNAEVPAGNAKGSWTGLTIQFNNKAGVNQDACKGATVNLAYSAN
jgi:hypothetical protein